jgi:hypothetical protein
VMPTSPNAHAAQDLNFRSGAPDDMDRTEWS